MAAPATPDEFLDLVRKSGVVDEKRLDSYVQHLRSSGSIPDDAAKLAGFLVRDGLLTHFQAEQIMLGKWRRFTIGKYRVLERLGSGGMGSVYLCEHKFMRRRVAVKVLPAAKAEDQASLERFYREARAAAALDHPNIVRAYDIDQDENLHFLVMEYVEGASLQEIVKKFGPLTILYACHYIRQAAIGLRHAHEAGLVHRDIKPGNVLVDRSGTVKVLDMGLARFFHDEEDILTKKYDESVLGTADYLAPEQALDSHSVDIRADVYSLGATFYFCLTGGPPFSEGTVAQKLIWHQTRQPKPVRSVRAEVPEALALIIDRMMTKDRSKRFQTPAQVVDALAPWTTNPIAPPPEPWMPRLSPAAMAAAPADHSSVAAPTPTPMNLPAAAGRPAGATPPPTRPVQPPMAPARAGVAQAARQPAATQPRTTTPARPAAPPGNGAFNPPGSAHDQPAPDWGEMAAGRGTPPAQKASGSQMNQPAIKGTRLEYWKQRISNLPRPWLILGIAGAALVGLLFLFLIGKALLGGGSSSAKPTGKADATRDVRTIHVGQKGEVKSIKDALARAAQGDRIVVQDEIIEEQLDLNQFNSLPRDLVIESDPSLKRVVWRPPPGKAAQQPAQQLLLLAHAEGLTLRRFHIQGQNSSQQTLDLIVLFGKCPGLKLEDIHFQSFKRSAVKLSNCSGDANRPIVLRKLHTWGAAAPEASALTLDVKGNYSMLTAMQHVRVEDCLFEGPHRFGVELQIDGGCELNQVAFLRNRFFKTTDAFFFRKTTKKPLPALGMTIDSNTCFEMERAVFFETMPLDRSPVTMKNNLFVQVKAIVQVNELSSPAAGVQLFPPDAGNVRDDKSKEGNVNLKCIQADCAGLSREPGSDRQQLLRYPKGGPLAQAGKDKGPVGAPPTE